MHMDALKATGFSSGGPGDKIVTKNLSEGHRKCSAGTISLTEKSGSGEHRRWRSGYSRGLLSRSMVLCVVALCWACELPQRSHSLGVKAPIAATFATADAAATVCAIQPGPKQSIACWPPDSSKLVLPQVSFYGLVGGSGFFCGLRQSSRAPFCWPTAATSRPTRLSKNRFTDLTVGASHVCGIREEDANVQCWRNNSHGQASPPLGLSFKAIAAGGSFTCGITVLNSTQCWGDTALILNDHPTIGELSFLQAGVGHLCGLKMPGNDPYCWGSNETGQTQVPQGKRFVSFALGASHSCGLLEDTLEALCWGDNSFGQLNAPQNVSFLSLSAGNDYTCGVNDVGLSVICWGRGFPVAAGPYPLPMKAVPSTCSASSCPPGTYAFAEALCESLPEQACVPCRVGCPQGYTESLSCGLHTDRQCYHTVQSPLPLPLPLPPPPLRSHHRLPLAVVAITLGSTGCAFGLISLVFWLGWMCSQSHEQCCILWCCGTPEKCKVHDSAAADAELPSLTAIAAPKAPPKDRHRSIGSFGHAIAFTFGELEQSTDWFSEEKKIGAGSFGAVYYGKLSNGREVAIKRGQTQPGAKKYQEKEMAFLSELGFLGRLHHKHLVSLVGFCAEEDERLLVYEFMPNGTLHDHLHKVNSNSHTSPLRSWQMRMKIALQAATGIEYLHNYAAPSIIHRDIKSSNILLDETWSARVSDFGLSLPAPLGDESHLSLMAAGTVGYIDPDYFRLQQLTPKSDVYSFGVVLLELLTGKRAVFKKNNGPVNLVDYAVPYLLADELYTVLDPNADPPRSLEIEAILTLAEVAEQCVRLDCKERPSMTEVVSRLERINSLFAAFRKLKERTNSLRE